MTTDWLILPLLANVILTFIVQAVMYRDRMRALKANKIHPSQVVDRRELERRIPQANASSNSFINQFEIPVIFYALMLLFVVKNWGGWIDFSLATAFVVSRSVHAYVHCTSNRIKYRFYSYLFGSVLLWLLTARMAWLWVVSVF